VLATLPAELAQYPRSQTVEVFTQGEAYRPKNVLGIAGFYRKELTEGGYHFLRFGLGVDHASGSSTCPPFGHADVYQSASLDVSYLYFLSGQARGFWVQGGLGYGNSRLTQTVAYPGELNPASSPRYELVTLQSNGTLRITETVGYGFSRHWGAEAGFVFEKFAKTNAQVQTAYWNGSSGSFQSPVTSVTVQDVTVEANLVRIAVDFYF
jgi:hypothetical protein